MGSLTWIVGTLMLVGWAMAPTPQPSIAIKAFKFRPDTILTLKTVIDAQAAKDPTKACMETRTAASHMSMIANPLADAIIKQFPSRFASR